MYFYGLYERKHILLGTHTGKPLLIAKSRSAHLLSETFPQHLLLTRLRRFPSQDYRRLPNVPGGKEHGPSKLLLLWRALFNAEEIGCIIS